MLEQQYLKTMIDAVKYDHDDDNKDAILGILRNSIITYDRTSTYGGKSGYFREYVCLRVPIPMLKKAKEVKDVLEKIASEVYIEPTDTVHDYEFWGFRIKPKPVELEDDSNVEHNVVFDDIKDEIIQGIRNAKYTIWVAVAWFTDRDIFQELLFRQKEGVHIRIITSDESSNRYLLQDLERNFEVVKIPLKGDKLSNRLHVKFCIIDLEFVMHGSYNWSKNARNNEETLATALDRDFVRKFADEFIRLFVEGR
jgi:phosphatidylserine/phosphatidylglycerophosphate/cardiolipin synthase-like enzyme